MEKNNKGFTLIEVLAVVVILGLIMVIAMPTYTAVYNSIKRTTYLNKTKLVTTAAKSYANNGYIKDALKKAAVDDTISNWYITINIEDMIKAGLIQSDDDNIEMIEDIYTGKPIGYNKSAVDGFTSSSSVALVYCYETYDVDAYIINDVAPGGSYHIGEMVRFKGSPYDEFREVKTEFSFDAFSKKVRQEYVAGEESMYIIYKGEEIDFMPLVGVDFEDSDAFNEAIAKMAKIAFTRETSCNHVR